MLPHGTALEVNEYRLVLVKSGSNAIWAERRGHDFCLPRIVIPRWTRPAEQLQEGVKAAWHLRTIVLDVLPGKNGFIPCAVVEILSSEPQDGLAKGRLDEIIDEEITGEEREVVKAILAGDTGLRGPFSRLGWIQESMQWLRAEVGQGITFTGEIRQYNASASFALVRFATQAGPAYWLKATGEPNAHEFQITRKLAELCPALLPRRVAAREDWNAWLMEEAGQPLDSWTLPEFENAISSMAILQKETVGRTKEFLAVGAADQRISTLRTHLIELIEYLVEAMAKQTSNRVPKIGTRRLWQMSALLREACFRTEDLAIPDTLVHNDINSGNILFARTRCVFTDWCEIGVGNPFFGFQYLRLLQASGDKDRKPRVQEIYRQCWLDHLSTSQIDQAFTLTPPLAILSYLYGRGEWLRSSRRNEPNVEAYARSLARHMDRATQALKPLEASCQ
jgi:hypothetical protein